MEYQEYSPLQALSVYIRCFWTLEDLSPTHPPVREKIFPDGCTELIFHYGDHFRKYDNEQDFHIQEKSFLHGQLTRYMEIEPTGRVGIFSLRFQPGGLQPFIPVPVSSLTEKTVSLSNLWQEEGQRLEADVLAATTNVERKNILEKFLLKKLEQKNSDKEPALQLAKTIASSEGTLNTEELAAKLQISKRHFEKTFVACVGLKPKMLARILRFNNALRLIEAGELDSFTAIAHEGGFYDQAHFIKDFKDITGLNPKKYYSENLEMTRFFNL